MTINYQFGDVDAHGATFRAQAASLEAEHQAIVRDVLAAGDLWDGGGSAACQEFIVALGRNFQAIYEQANAHGQNVQTAGSNMASTDSTVGSSWAQRRPCPTTMTVDMSRQHRGALANSMRSGVIAALPHTWNLLFDNGGIGGHIIRDRRG